MAFRAFGATFAYRARLTGSTCAKPIGAGAGLAFVAFKLLLRGRLAAQEPAAAAP